MSSSLSAPSSRLPNRSPQPMEGVQIPPPMEIDIDIDIDSAAEEESPEPPNQTTQREEVETTKTTQTKQAAVKERQMDIGADVHARHPPAASLTAEEERDQFSRLYKSQLVKDDEYSVVPSKWFESWVAYSGFDRHAADNGVASLSSPSEQSSRRAGGGERPGYIDCSILLQSPPDTLDLTSTVHATQDGTLRSTWIELREDVQENVDFVTINYDAFLRLCEWYGGGPLILRKVVALGLSQVETIELHPCHLVVTPIVNGAIQLSQRRVKTIPKAMTLTQMIEENKPKQLTPDEKSKMEGRVWKRRTTPLDPNVLLQNPDIVLDLTGPGPSALNAARQTPAEFVREWEVATRLEVLDKLEFLEWKRGTEIMIEYRSSSTEAWSMASNGSLTDREWSEFQKDDVIDCCDPEGKWYQAEIKELMQDPMRGRCAKVHFMNWSIKYDEVIPISPASLVYTPYTPKVSRFAPKYAFTNHAHIPNLPKKKVPDDPYSYTGSGVFNRQNSVGQPEVKGAVGLRNLGNTCFMNSTLQCLANTPGLTEFFTDGKYTRYLNRTNPLGFKGRIAEEYGALLKEIWSGAYSTVTPRGLKQVIGEFNPRFSGYAQQDSSELLSFLLDGLHEDLNRVLQKPQTQPVESNGRPDAIVAQESWNRHLQRNQSVIVDLCQGQYKSCVVCPKCHKQSVTFDPFSQQRAHAP